MPRLVILLSFVVAIAPPFARAPVGRNGYSNVLLIMTDDAGYGDFGSYGASDIKTPHIDGLTRDGVRLTDFYANGPNCTSTRAALMTGRYQQRYALGRPLATATSADKELGLPASGRSLPQLLKNNGYATALIGKWHLGYKPKFSPAAHGFEYFFGFKSGYVDYYQHTDAEGRPDMFENDNPVKTAGYMTDIITERSVQFILEHKDHPFFIDIAYNAPHWPYQTPGKPSTARANGADLGPFDESPKTRADYVAMLERVDRGVGEIVGVLDSLDLTKNTMVIFTNDNGGEWLSHSAPLFNHKDTVWEGGIRVPMIVKWPGHLPAGKVSGQVGITMDLTATILAATETPVPREARLDGINLIPVLDGSAPTIDRTLFWLVPGTLPQMAVRSGDWKLVYSRRSMLFNVRQDLGERDDLIGEHSDIARRLGRLFKAWEQDVDAEAKGVTSR